MKLELAPDGGRLAPAAPTVGRHWRGGGEGEEDDGEGDCERDCDRASGGCVSEVERLRD
jgi:hypothetical protein